VGGAQRAYHRPRSTVHILDTLGCFDAALQWCFHARSRVVSPEIGALQLAGTRSAAGAVDHPVNSPDGDVSPRSGATAGSNGDGREKVNTG